MLNTTMFSSAKRRGLIEAMMLRNRFIDLIRFPRLNAEASLKHRVNYIRLNLSPSFPRLNAEASLKLILQKKNNQLELVFLG